MPEMMVAGRQLELVTIGRELCRMIGMVTKTIYVIDIHGIYIYIEL